MADNCPIADAEVLLQLLQKFPSASLDWTKCNSLHTAVLQVILAARPILTGPCGDSFVADWLDSS